MHVALVIGFIDLRRPSSQALAHIDEDAQCRGELHAEALAELERRWAENTAAKPPLTFINWSQGSTKTWKERQEQAVAPAAL